MDPCSDLLICGFGDVEAVVDLGNIIAVGFEIADNVVDALFKLLTVLYGYDLANSIAVVAVFILLRCFLSYEKYFENHDLLDV